MSASNWIRQTHRWVSIAFTVAMIVNVVALVLQAQAVWMVFVAVVPLLFLMLTGLYMFALPYFATPRRARRADPAAMSPAQ